MTYTKKKLFLSKRAQAIQPSITMTISSLAQTLRAQGEPVIGFGAGEPDFDTSQHIKDAGIKAIQDGFNKYTPVAGVPELKRAITEKVSTDQGLSVTPDQVVVSCGAKHSCYNVFMALINPGDEVIIPTPYWVSYPEQVCLQGGVPVYVETNDNSQFKLNAQQLEAAITPRTKGVILNSPSNPTGMLYTRAELEDLAKVILKHGIFVLSDEIYEKLIYGKAQHISIASLGKEIEAQTIIVNGVSKSHAMTGWRIGYTVSNLAIAKAMSNMQSHMTSNPCSNAQWAAIEALTGPQGDTIERKEAFDERRSLMVTQLNNMPYISCLNPEGAFYAFPNISQAFGKKSPSGPITGSVSFCERLLTDAKIACVPGAGFGADNYMRLSYATSQENINNGLSRLKEWLQTLQ